MKRIAEYKKLLNVESEIDLKELKLLYRNVMKTVHPDKFTDPVEKEAAEIQSTKLIEAYSFLVSIAPETHEANAEVYEQTLNTPIVDFQYKQGNLKITFGDGSVYEYLGVTRNTYSKLVNSATIARFARRHIFHSHVYRNISKQTNA